MRLSGHILDAGCGTGWKTAEFKIVREDLKIGGCDKDRLTLAKNNFTSRGIDFYKGDVENVPFQDYQFDTVLMLDVLEHTKNPARVLFEVSRVFKKVLAVFLNLRLLIFFPTKKPEVTR